MLLNASAFRYYDKVAKINSLEAEYRVLSDAELKAKTGTVRFDDPKKHEEQIFFVREWKKANRWNLFW